MAENEIITNLLEGYPTNMQAKDVAAFLNVSQSTVYKLIKQGGLPVMTMPGGRIHLIPKHKFLMWYSQQIENQQAENLIE
jgi:excisionase family DNA binding protein